MANPVVVEFVLRGMPDIARAMKTVEQSAAASDRARERTAEKASKARTKLEEKEAKEKLRAQVKADADARRLLEKQTREAEKAAKAKAKAEERLTREQGRELKERARAEEKEMRDMVRAAEKAANDKLRIQAKVDREIAKMDKDRARERTRADKERNRENEKLLREGQRLEERTHREQTRAIQRRDKEKEKSRERFNRAIGGAMMGAANTAVGAVGTAAGMVAQLGGGFSLVDSVDRESQLQRTAVELSNSAYQGEGQRLKGKDLAAQAKAASILTGTDANDLLEGAAAFGAKTGNYGEGIQSMKLFGEISKGTGAKLQDVAKTAGILRVQNKNLDPKAMQDLLLQTVRQGQLGSIEFSDLAGVAGQITRSAPAFAGNQTANQGKLLGLAQIAMRTAGSPQEAATVLSNLSADAMKHSEDMKDVLGKDMFNDKGQISAAPEDFIANVMEKTGGNLMKIQEMGFGARSMKMFQALAPTYHEAEEKEKGSGRKAVLEDIKSVTSGTMSIEELRANVKEILDTSAEQFDAAMRELRTVVGTELLPEFVKLVPVLREMMPTVKTLLTGLVGLADWATKNPLSGLATLLGAAFTKELASAGVAAALQGGVATGLAGATLAIAAATLIIENIASSQSARVSKEVGGAASAYSEGAAVRAGDTLTPENLENLKKQQAAMSAQVDEQRKNVNSKDAIEYVGMAGNFIRDAVSVVGGGDFGVASSEDYSADYQKQREQRLKLSEEALERLNKALDMAAKGLVKVGEAADKPPIPGVPPPGAPKGGPPARPSTASQGLVQRSRVE